MPKSVRHVAYCVLKGKRHDLDVTQDPACTVHTGQCSMLCCPWPVTHCVHHNGRGFTSVSLYHTRFGRHWGPRGRGIVPVQKVACTGRHVVDE